MKQLLKGLRVWYCHVRQHRPGVHLSYERQANMPPTYWSPHVVVIGRCQRCESLVLIRWGDV